MKKMYYLAVAVILAITLLFVVFSCDENATCIKFLKKYGYETENLPILYETYIIPHEFDSVLTDYNLTQLSQGFDLSAYKGKSSIKCTYKITNCTELPYPILANFILVGGKIVSADLMNPRLDGFIMPVIYKNDLIKYQSPAMNDAVIP